VELVFLDPTRRNAACQEAARSLEAALGHSTRLEDRAVLVLREQFQLRGEPQPFGAHLDALYRADVQGWSRLTEDGARRQRQHGNCETHFQRALLQD
jgi:hypothetical protein